MIERLITKIIPTEADKTEIYTRSYIYLNNQIIGFIDKKDSDECVCRYTITDKLGSVTKVYSENTETNELELLWQSGYTAFGVPTGKVANAFDEIFTLEGLFTGKDYDSDTGLTYHWNRWRSEDGSTWLSEDPARDGSNWYGYCGQNPISVMDPTGLEGEKGDSSSGANEGTTSGAQEAAAPNVPTNSTSALPENVTTPNNNLSGEEKENYSVSQPDIDYLLTINPKSPYYQNSDELGFIDDFRLNACNFMSYLFEVQDYTGYNFSISEIACLIGFAQNEPNPANQDEMCMTSDFDVRNPDVIMNEAFKLAGNKELTATVGWGAEENQSPSYTNVTVLTDIGNIHRVTGDKNGNIIYNPWKGGGIRNKLSVLEVYIHGVKQK